MGVEFSSFDNNRPLYRRRYKIGLFFRWIINRKSPVHIDPCQFLWPWVTLKGETQVTQIFRLTSARMFVLFDQQRSLFDLRWPNLTCSEERVSRGKPDPIPRERGYSTYKYFRVSFSNTVSPTTINFGVLTPMEWHVSRGTDMISVQEAGIEHSRFFLRGYLRPGR